MKDTRIAYGAQCTWWDSIAKVGRLPSGLPCCPHCSGVLFEMESEAKWWAAVDAHAVVERDYRAFIEWGRGKCFDGYSQAKAAFAQDRGLGAPPHISPPAEIPS